MSYLSEKLVKHGAWRRRRGMPRWKHMQVDDYDMTNSFSTAPFALIIACFAWTLSPAMLD